MRPVKWYDVILLLLVPSGYAGYVTPNRLLAWSAGLLSTGSLLLLFALGLTPTTLTPWRYYLYGAIYALQVVIAMSVWLKYRHEDNDGSLPRPVLLSDMLLAILCPPSVVAVHRSARWQWVLVGVLWQWALVALSERAQGGDMQGWLVRAATVHAVAILVAGVSNIISHRMYLYMVRGHNDV